MKRFLITLVVVLVGFPLVLGSIVGLAFYSTGQDTVPDISVVVQGNEVGPNGYEWHSPVLGGMLHRTFSRPSTLETTNLGYLDTTTLNVSYPEGYAATAVLTHGNKQVWNGSADALSTFRLKGNGRYLLELNCEKTEDSYAYGSFNFRAAFKVKIEPALEVSAEALHQGDVLAVRVYNLEEGVEVLGDAEGEPVLFSPTGAGAFTGYVPVTYGQEPGRYEMLVTAGDFTQTVSYEVLAVNFPPAKDGAQPSWRRPWDSAAKDELKSYQDAIPQLYRTGDTNRYWRGPFLLPVQGEITQEYGAVISLSRTSSTQSSGINILPAEDAEVVAPNAGRVVFAEELLDTGNTVVIEHGGGLKSYFFHLKGLSVLEGNTVRQGDIIGYAGKAEGASDATLQYEVLLGRGPINPQLLAEGTSGLLYFEKQDEESGEAQTRLGAVPASSSGASGPEEDWLQ